MNKVEKSRSQLVVIGNELLQKGRYNLTSNQQKLISYVISMIKPTDKELTWFKIDISHFCAICGIDRNHFYSEFKDMIDSLDSKAFWVENEEKLFKFRWFSEVKVEKNSGEIIVLLNSELQKYLIDLENNFTQFELYNVLPLKSKYSNRLYQLLKSYAYQRQKQISVQELKNILFAETYTKFKDFRKRVLDNALEEIDLYTDITVTYETIKSGRKIESILFHIIPKNSYDVYISYKNTIKMLDKE